ncbi:MAG: hypothetical protein NVS2B4_09810 [Ramlibacter sp.]
MRPGETLYEELLADDEVTLPTPHPKLRISRSDGGLPDADAIAARIDTAGPAPSDAVVRGWLRAQVPEYSAR